MAFKYYGGKLRRWEELSRDYQADLLYDFLSSLMQLKGQDETISFVTDLLTRDEVKILSKRLRVAKLLLAGRSYEEIRRELRSSPPTIAKVAAWLNEKGEGFRKIISRIPKRKTLKHWSQEGPVGRFKRSRPASFWPELLLKDWENRSIKNENEKLKRTIDVLGSKDVVRHRVDEQYREERNQH